MSMIEGTQHHSTETTVLSADEWVALLTEESVRLHSLGIRSGVISIDFSATTDPGLFRDRAVRLLRRGLRSTDRIGLTSEGSLAILHAPLPSLPELDRMSRQIDVHLDGAGMPASIGFAHRRTGEDLLDTFARADAQADRASFRREHPSGEGLRLS